MIVRRLDAGLLPDAIGELAGLLTATVDAGASVGFLAPLHRAEAAAWWTRCAGEVAGGRRAVWAAQADDRMLGTVSLVFPGMPNGRHRAEITKLMVHPDARGRGLGRRLLTVAEQAARAAGVGLLHLDTETGSPAEHLYRAAGWARAGTIPDYAASPDGTLRPTTLYYKHVGKAAAD
ncbi:N-acetyltransferase family protein [Streptomyces sp. MS06]|uniref:GNAT family N-acetyltransferase n=1 Tax=Streptomyces sp. MS06 TaxID=3385974 RepID=UPI00399F4C20